MSRSPLAYPLARGIDGDAGGAADLQTDIMRFMAILSLCLVAIFALVQSLPMTAEPTPAAASPATVAGEQPRPAPVAKPPEPLERSAAPPPPKPSVQAASPKPPPASRAASARPTPTPVPPAPATPIQDEQGFTLRFASDLALTRLVARGDIAFYALGSDVTRQLSVRSSQLRFWASPQPSEYHEMERSTVPAPVVDALGLTGQELEEIRWGVTLPDRLSTNLARLMREHSGGALIIDADGSLRREPS